MSTNPIILSAELFESTATELLSIAKNSILSSYPPYNLDIYNTYIRDTALPKSTFIPRPIPNLLIPEEQINSVYPNLDKTEPDMLSFNNNNCDIFATDLDYDLDIESMKESDILINHNLDITPYSADISGIWRPYILYIDPTDSSKKNTLISRSGGAQENPYEAGLGIENFITINNPRFKSWQLSDGAVFNVDWKIEKDNFLTAQFLGVLFWYRYYDIEREAENNIKQTFVINEYREAVYYDSYQELEYEGKTYNEQHIDHTYSKSTASQNIERFGLHSGLKDGDRVLIKENNKEYIYEVNKSYWTCLGEKRFLPGVDIYVPEDQFLAYFESTFDMEDWNNRDKDPTKITNSNYPRTKLLTNDLDRYSNILNKILDFNKHNNVLQNLFARFSQIPNQDEGTDSGAGQGEQNQEDSGSILAGIYMDKQNQLNYIAAKNLARFLCTSPFGADISYVDPYYLRIDKTNLYTSKSIVEFKTALENIFGKNFPTAASVNKDKHKLYANDSMGVSAGEETVREVITGYARVWNPFTEKWENTGDYGVLSDQSYSGGLSPPVNSEDSLRINIQQRLSTLAHSFSSNIVATKKDLLRCLLKTNKKNRYIKFSPDKKSKILSKFSIEEPHLRMVLDFQDKKRLGIGRNDSAKAWYKQRISACGLELFTRLKLPNAQALKKDEEEAILLQYVNPDGTVDNKLEVPIMSALETVDTSREYYNQVIKNVYEKFGIAQKFQQKYTIERNILQSDGQGEYFDILFTDTKSLTPAFRLLKNTSYQENQTFDNSIRYYNRTLDEYTKNNDGFKKTLNFVDQRFAEMSLGNQGSVFPNIKEVYIHKLGGFYFTDISLITIGKSKFWKTKTAPVGIKDAQYFLPQSVGNKYKTRPTNNKYISIEFECGADTTVELYSIKIEKLRDNKLEDGNCRQFPNKLALFGDETRVYDAIIGYEFNESSHLLTTRTAPPIVAYGGHRADHVAELGVKIPGHPQPISSSQIVTHGSDEYPIYSITSGNVLPATAKNSFYYIQDKTQLEKKAKQLGVTEIKDKSLVKCFLTPSSFNNEIIFRKGFFHPNKGWIDYTLFPAEPADNKLDINNRTAVKNILESPCKIYHGQGTLFTEMQLTVGQDLLKPGGTISSKDYQLIMRDPMETYWDSIRGIPGSPNILTVEVDENTDFITYLAVILKNFTHPVPKELKVALFDPLEQRWIAYNIIAQYLNGLLRDPNANEDPSFAKKIQLQLIKEKNAWLGSWQKKARTSPRHILFHSTMKNYSSNFYGIFSNFSKKNSLYAFSRDFILPAQSLDYYVGTSGVYRGFWTYDGEFPPTIDNGDGIQIPDPDAPEYVGENSNEIARKWGLQISDMGAEDEGAACFDLQVCTGCPVPGYTQSYIYNRFQYNNETFNIPYVSGYNFIANFRNKLHLIPPINIDAPYNTIDQEYPKTNVGSTSSYALQLGCLPEPDPPRPRETILPEFPPPPVFLPPFYPSLIGLLTYMGIAESMQAQGYGWDLGFLTGAFFPSPLFYGASRREKMRRYMENKGYLQIEGTTAAALKLGFGQGQNISLYDDKPYGQPDKIQLEVQHTNGLWYNIEADIFRYSSHSSPVLENTKFHYLRDVKYVNKNGEESDNYIKPLEYPGFDFNFNSTGSTDIIIDGVRAYYSFMVGDKIDVMYKLHKHESQPPADRCHPCTTKYEGNSIVSYKYTAQIINIEIMKISNPRFVPTDLKIQNPESIEQDLITPDLFPESYLDEQTNPREIEISQVKITLDISIPKDAFGGCIYKADGAKSRSFLLIDPLLTNAVLGSSGLVNYRKNNEEPAFTSSLAEFGYSFINNNELLDIGKWSNIRDRSMGTFTTSYRNDQMFAEGGLGWGTNLLRPENIPTVGNQEKYVSLLDLDYHFSKTNFCGKIKFTKDFDEDNTHIANVKFQPRKTYSSTPKHNYSTARDDEFIVFSGQPKNLTSIPNRIYAHNVFSISEKNNQSLHIDLEEKIKAYDKNKDISEFYLPFYDLTLDCDILDDDLKSYAPVISSGLKDKAGYLQIENIFNNKNDVVYDNNYYWISIPNSGISGVLSSSSKIPVAVIQKCFHSKGSYSFCNNICNTQMIGPVWPNMNDQNRNSMELIYKLPDEETPKQPGVEYEERQTQQTFYMGCGESKNDSMVRVEVTQVYRVPTGTHTYISAKELLENANEIKTKFKYLPRKIPTDFRLTLGSNIVNQSQLYLWECHKTNLYNIYNKNTVTNTPPFYQVLNEMIFRAWFGERQKISLQDTYDQRLFFQQNHYKWVPYDYDDSGIFQNERDM